MQAKSASIFRLPAIASPMPACPYPSNNLRWHSDCSMREICSLAHLAIDTPIPAGREWPAMRDPALMLQRPNELIPMKATLAKLLSAVPFRTFGIHLPSRLFILIDSPHMVAISPTKDEIIAFSNDGNYHFIPIAKVVDLEVMSQELPPL